VTGELQEVISMALGAFLLWSAMALPFVGLLLASRVTGQRRVARPRRSDAAEVAGPPIQTRSAASSHRADWPSLRRRVALRRVPFPHATTPRPACRLLPVARLRLLDRPARSAACTAVPRTDRSGLGHGGSTEAPNSDGAAVA